MNVRQKPTVRRAGKITLHSALLTTVLALLCGPVFAQYGGMGGVGGSRRGTMGMPSNRSVPLESSATAGAPAQQLEDRLYDLRMRLLVTPEQARLWDVFHAKTLALTFPTSGGSAPGVVETAVQAVEQRLSAAQNRYAAMEQLSDAVKALYLALTPDQQRIADQHLPPVISSAQGEAGFRNPMRRPPG